MINTIELRKGNHIHDEYGSLCKVIEIHENKLVYEYVDKLKPDGTKDYSIITANVEICNPIFLTKNIMLEYGFEKDKLVTKADGGTEVAYINGPIFMLQSVNGSWYAAPFGYPLHPMRTLYLHQLQNLNYAIGGKELEPKKA